LLGAEEGDPKKMRQRWAYTERVHSLLYPSKVRRPPGHRGRELYMAPEGVRKEEAGGHNFTTKKKKGGIAARIQGDESRKRGQSLWERDTEKNPRKGFHVRKKPTSPPRRRKERRTSSKRRPPYPLLHAGRIDGHGPQRGEIPTIGSRKATLR